jgi:transcriptional regulator with XRE-family HTH domain
VESDNKEKSVGEIIAGARRQTGLSLRELAGRISIHFTYLADIEKNRRPATEKVIKGLSEQKELNLDFDFLMALSSRFGEEVENYYKNHPNFGSLMRQIVKENLSDTELKNLRQDISHIINKVRASK